MCKVDYGVGGLVSDHILTKAARWLNGTPKVERMLNHEGALGAEQFTDPSERLCRSSMVEPTTTAKSFWNGQLLLVTFII